MKKFYAILCIAIVSLTQLQAQAPQGFNYQATVRNSSGDLIVNTNVYFKFNVIQGSQTAVPIFTETHYVPTDDLGQVNLVIGQGTATEGTFSELDWSLGSYYLGIELNTGSSYVAMGTKQLLSVPYALYAANSGNSTPTTPTLQSVLAENNSANNQQIKDLQDPTEAQDAVTKNYTYSKAEVDALISSAVANLQSQIDDLESDNSSGSVTDQDGNTYDYLTYGDKVWTVENAEMVTYRDGTPIPQVTDNTEWESLTTGAWAYYNNDPAKGKLYNWYAVAGIHDTDPNTPNKEFAPEGWHVPSDAEMFHTLYEIVMADSSLNVRNSSGFNVIPVGRRGNDGSFLNEGNYAFFWSSTESEDSTNHALNSYMPGDISFLITEMRLKRNGFSVRFVRGEAVNPNDIDDDADGYTENFGDCDDFDASINPGATEIEDGVDNDCDGEIDEDLETNTVTDQDGNTYDYLTYGNQVWTVENAEMVTYRDGTEIPQVTDNTEWQNLTTGAWAYYNNDSTKPRLYNWYAVMGIHDTDPNTPNKEFAPEGWHVPTDAEWTTLEEHLIANGYNYDESTTENKIAKAMASTTGWRSSTNTGAPGNDQSLNNSSGFNAFPEGNRSFDGSFSNEGVNGVFWSSAESNTNYAWNRDDYGRTSYQFNYFGVNVTRHYGFSVRFVRGEVDPDETDNDNDGYTENQGDCDDNNSNVYPGATEIEDGVDNDCDGDIDEGFNASGTVTDQDGNTYNYITYGNQVWTVENAEMVTYRDGTTIPQVTDATEWRNLTTGAWCYYDNDPTKGKLYNWYAVMGIHDTDPNTSNKEFAPEGWHVPSDAEWTTLENYLIANGYNYDGTTTGNKIAKAMASTTGWNSSTNTGATGNDQSLNNDSGFNAFPEGYRYFKFGSFTSEGYFAFFWSSTEYDAYYAGTRYLYYDTSYLDRDGDNKQSGVSVRFVRD